jgi:hypothetical protein
MDTNMELLDMDTIDDMAKMDTTKKEEMDTTSEDLSQQEWLEQLLYDVDESAPEWIITVSLQGEFDLSFIENRGYRCLKKIVFQAAGGITALHHVPKQLEVLYCTRQQLKNLATFFSNPATCHLEELYLDDNPLESIEALGYWSHLQVLSMNRHQVNEIRYLPASLEELYCKSGPLETLYLVHPVKNGTENDLSRLVVLHIDGNTVPLVIYHMPSSVVDFETGNTQYHVISASQKEVHLKEKERKQETDYQKALNQYFEIKHEYERRLLPRSHPDNEGKSNNKGVDKGVVNNNNMSVLCVNCNQTGGTMFRRENNHYLAKCGHVAKPCMLDIKLFCGVYNNVGTLLSNYREQARDMEQEIIRLRLETVFGFVDEKEATKKGKQLIQMYKETKQITEKLQQKSRSFNENVLKQRLQDWNEVNQQIHEAITELKHMAQEPNILTTEIVRFQADTLVPLQKKRQQLCYEADKMHVDIFDDGNQTNPVSHLIQTRFDMDHGEEINTAEPPRVIRFVLN